MQIRLGYICTVLDMGESFLAKHTSLTSNVQYHYFNLGGKVNDGSSDTRTYTANKELPFIPDIYWYNFVITSGDVPRGYNASYSYVQPVALNPEIDTSNDITFNTPYGAGTKIIIKTDGTLILEWPNKWTPTTLRSFDFWLFFIKFTP